MGLTYIINSPDEGSYQALEQTLEQSEITLRLPYINTIIATIDDELARELYDKEYILSQPVTLTLESVVHRQEAGTQNQLSSHPRPSQQPERP